MPGASPPLLLRLFAGLSLPPPAGRGGDAARFSTSASVACRLQILAFGDSLTQQAALPDGWYTLLASRYQGRADLINRGYSGYTTRNALTTLRQHIRAGIWPYVPSAQQPLAGLPGSSAAQPRLQRLVIVWLGSNDSCTHFTSTPNMHTPCDTFTANMRHIVRTLRPAGPDTHGGHIGRLTARPATSQCTALLLLTPLDKPHWLAYRRFKYGTLPSRLSAALPPPMEYVEAVKAVGEECGVAVCDVSGGSVLPAAVNHEWSVDGVHLNAAGNKRVFEALVGVIEQH